MIYLDLTLPSPEENLACDEALLDAAEEDGAAEVLRFWEPAQYFAVLGFSNKIAQEINTGACASLGVPVLRRPSGGGTVLQGPGCLNYSLILKINEDSLKSVTAANHSIMQKNCAALQTLLNPSEDVKIQGTTDLTFRGLKFSGNAQRRKKRNLLFHGTFLLGFDISIIEKTLLPPPRQPDYRKKRAHKDFLMNLNLPAEKVKKALRFAWKTEKKVQNAPQKRIDLLIAEKYSKKEWNLKF